MADIDVSKKLGIPVVLPVFDTVWTPYTGAIIGGGAKVFTIQTLSYRQRLNGYEITFSFSGNTTASGGGSTALQLPLPSGALVDFNALGSNVVTSDANNEGWGYDYGITSTGNYTPLAAVVPYSTTTIGFIRSGISGFISGVNINSTNGVQLTGKVWVPIQGLSAYRAYGAGRVTSIKDGLATPRTAQIDLTSLISIAGVTGLVVNQALGYAYSDINGNWRLSANIVCSFTATSTASIGVTLSGTVFKNASGFLQPFSGFLSNSTAAGRNYTTPNTGTLTVAIPSAVSTDAVYISCDVALNAKPTWA